MANKQRGFLLLPVFFMLLLSSLILVAASKELRQSLRTHHLKMNKNCHRLEQQINATDKQCPACPQGIACYERL